MLSTPVLVAVLAVVALLGLVVGVDLAYSVVQQRRLRRGRGAGGISSSGKVTHRGITSSFAWFAARTVGGAGNAPEKDQRR